MTFLSANYIVCLCVFSRKNSRKICFMIFLAKSCRLSVYMFFMILLGQSFNSFIFRWVFPKIMVPPNHPILIGCSIINHPFWGTPIFGNIQMLFFVLFLVKFLELLATSQLNVAMFFPKLLEANSEKPIPSLQICLAREFLCSPVPGIC